MAEKIEQRAVSVRIDGKEIENSLKSIQNEARNLRNELSKMEEGTDSYVRKAVALEQANEAAKKNRESVMRIAEAWQNMPDEVRKSVTDMQTKLVGLRKNFEDVLKAGGDTRTPEMRALKGEISSLAKSIKDTTSEFIGLKKQAADGSWDRIEADIKEVTAALKAATRGSEAYYKSVSELNRLNADLDKHKAELKHVEQAWYKNIPAVQSFIAVSAGAFAIDRVVEYGKALFNDAKIMDTLVQKSASVLADQMGKINNEAEKHAHSFGIARQQYVGATADMSAFFQSQFATREEGAKLGNEAVKLAGVLAGFRGGGADNFIEALDAIKGGFSDDVEELAKFNIALSDDIIKSAMAEKGLDKLNAKQQEHAKGALLLTLIQEKATAQMQAFGDTTGTMARQQAELEAKLKEIGNTLAIILIPVFNRLASVISGPLEAIEDFVEIVKKVADPARAASEAFYDQSAKVKDLEKELNPLLKRYDELEDKSKKVGGAAKLNKKEQAELKTVIQEIGEAVPATKIQVDNYGKALNINSGAAREFLEAQKTLSAFLNKDAIDQQENELKYNTARRNRLKENIELASQGKLGKNAWAWGVGQYSRKYDNSEIAQMTIDLEKLSKTVDGATLNLKRLKGEPIAPNIRPEIPKNLSGQSEDERKKQEQKEAEMKRHLERLREALKAHESDINAQNLRADERDAERIREKYRKDIELAESIEKDKGVSTVKQRKEAHDIRLKLEGDQESEITAKKKENAEKIIKELTELSDKFSINSADLLLDDLEKKLRSIREKYRQPLAKTEEATTLSADPNVKAQAEKTRTDLENAQNTEIEAARDEHLLAMYKKQELAWQKIQLGEASKEDAEVLAVIFHYQELIDLAVKNGDDTASLVQEQADRITAIRQKQREAEAAKHKKAEDSKLHYEKLMSDAAMKLQDYRLANLKSFSDLLGSVLSETARKSFAYFAVTKGLAIAEIIINSQREASAISVAYATAAAAQGIVPGRAAQLLATGVALSSAALTRGFLSATIVGTQGIVEYVAAQKADGGYVAVVGANDGKKYNAKNAGTATTGMVYDPTIFLTGEGSKKEYVIANPELSHPVVANFLPLVESIRQKRVKGYAQGGTVSDSEDDTIQASRPTVPTNNSRKEAFDNQLLDKLTDIHEALLSGKVIALVTTEGAFELLRAQNKAVEQAGYIPK